MAKNTKQRHLEILTAAHRLLEENEVDFSVQFTGPLARELTKELSELTDCHYNTARRNLYKAVRQKRYQISVEESIENWGGDRGGGRPPKETE